MAMTSIGALAQTHYPESPKGDVVDEYFGTKVADHYRWLEDDNSQETAKWVEAQNKVTDSIEGQTGQTHEGGGQLRENQCSIEA